MAGRILLKKRHVVAYLPSFKEAVRHFRAFSSYDENHTSKQWIEISVQDNGRSVPDSNTVWPDKHLGPFGPKDKRFPLPGLIGPSPAFKGPQQTSPQPPKLPRTDIENVLPPTNTERVNTVFEDYAGISEMTENLEESLLENNVPSAADYLECVAYDCPQLIRKDFMDLFPGMNIMQGSFTVITVSQKTEQDMTGWSYDIELERENLLEHFVQGATEICEALREVGFWADFIDPSSGRPYLGEYTNSTMFETDERYRHFGFEIKELGCCKVISHHLWGSHTYVGCLFTNAPVTHEIIRHMAEKKN